MAVAPVPSFGLSVGAIILALLSALGTAYIEVTHNDRETAQRVSALEQHKTDNDGRLERIENKVDRLVDWAIGHK